MKTYDKTSKEAKFLDILGRENNKATAIVARFGMRLVEDAAGALESDAVFGAAATLRVFQRTIHALIDDESKATLDTIREYATKEVLLGARNPSRSSSPATNLMHQATVAAWADLLDKLDWV